MERINIIYGRPGVDLRIAARKYGKGTGNADVKVGQICEVVWQIGLIQTLASGRVPIPSRRLYIRISLIFFVVRYVKGRGSFAYAAERRTRPSDEGNEGSAYSRTECIRSAPLPVARLS